jgi:hypothetical protein
MAVTADAGDEPSAVEALGVLGVAGDATEMLGVAVRALEVLGVAGGAESTGVDRARVASPSWGRTVVGDALDGVAGRPTAVASDVARGHRHPVWCFRQVTHTPAAFNRCCGGADLPIMWTKPPSMCSLASPLLCRFFVGVADASVDTWMWGWHGAGRTCTPIRVFSRIASRAAWLPTAPHAALRRAGGPAFGGDPGRAGVGSLSSAFHVAAAGTKVFASERARSTLILSILLISSMPVVVRLGSAHAVRATSASARRACARANVLVIEPSAVRTPTPMPAKPEWGGCRSGISAPSCGSSACLRSGACSRGTALRAPTRS